MRSTNQNLQIIAGSKGGMSDAQYLQYIANAVASFGGGGGGGGAPSGPAGGDLSGTYPNPTIGIGTAVEAWSAALDTLATGDGTALNVLASNVTGLFPRNQVDFTVTTISEASTLTLAHGSTSKVSLTGANAPYTIAFSGVPVATQPYTILKIIVSGAAYTITIPTSRRISDAGTTTTVTLPIGNHELSWAYDGSVFWLIDSTYDITITPTALSGNVNDYAPTGLATAATVRVDGGAADRNITGLDSTSTADNRVIRVLNIGATNNLTLINSSSSSSAANRFLLPADTVLPPNTALALSYDNTSARWRPWSRALANTGVVANSYGSATAAPSFTVDAAGRLTAAGTNTITPAEASITFTDITTGNASTSNHGFLKKLDNNAAHFMDGTGAWSTPSGATIPTGTGFTHITSGAQDAASKLIDLTADVSNAAGTALTVAPTGAAQVSSAVAGVAATFSASDATAGSSAGAAAGGDVLVKSGAAKRTTSGNAAGGDVMLNASAGIGTGGVGVIRFQAAGVNKFTINNINFAASSAANTITPGTTGGLVGTTAADNAQAGSYGEVISSLIASGSAVSLTTATAANVTSISLTAGDWNVWGVVSFTETSSTVTARVAGISTTTATVPTDGTEGYSGVQSTVTSETNSITLVPVRVNVSSTTTVYLVGKATFSAGTCAEFGAIFARRIR